MKRFSKLFSNSANRPVSPPNPYSPNSATCATRFWAGTRSFVIPVRFLSGIPYSLIYRCVRCSRVSISG